MPKTLRLPPGCAHTPGHVPARVRLALGAVLLLGLPACEPPRSGVERPLTSLSLPVCLALSATYPDSDNWSAPSVPTRLRLQGDPAWPPYTDSGFRNLVPRGATLFPNHPEAGSGWRPLGRDSILVLWRTGLLESRLELAWSRDTVTGRAVGRRTVHGTPDSFPRPETLSVLVTRLPLHSCDDVY